MATPESTAERLKILREGFYSGQDPEIVGPIDVPGEPDLKDFIIRIGDQVIKIRRCIYDSEEDFPSEE